MATLSPDQIAATNASSIASANAANAKNGLITTDQAKSSTFVDPASTSVLATSNGSRVQTAANVSSLAKANASIAPAGSTTTTTPSTTVNNGTTNTGGSSTSTGAAFTPPAGYTPSTLPSGAQTYYNATTGQMIDSTGKALTFSPQTNSWVDPATNQPPGVTAPGSSTASGAGGSSATDDGSDPTSGLDISPALKTQYQSTLSNLDTELQQQQENITALTATLANDPAAAAAAQSIMDKYNVLIQAMKDKNAQLLGRASTSVAASGGLGVMSQTFMSNEMDNASQRIATLVTQEQDLILKSNQAYQSGDLKALNAAQAEYDKVNTEKTTALRDLLTATNNQVKNVQAQTKIDNAATTAQINNDIKNSNGVAASVASQLIQNGITDLGSYDYTEMAKELGITDPTTLSAAVVKAGQTAQKATDAHANTVSTIAKRNQPKSTTAKGGGTDGGYTYTSDDVAQYTALLNKGGTAPDGTKIAKRGSDGYVDPSAYTAALKDWVANGGTPIGFAKKFPVKGNVNPESYGELPAGIQPKAATAATYTTN